MAGLQPGRFARLALRMPVDADPQYPVAILMALAERKPPREPAEGRDWEQATVVQVEAVIRRFAALEDDRDFAMAVCRAVRERSDGNWTDDTMLLLVRLATGHSDPQPGSTASRGARTRPGRGGRRPAGCGPERDQLRAGSAAGAIEAVLFERPERLGILQPAVESLLDDPHAAVRVAAVGLTLPLLNIDRGVAIDAFLRGVFPPG